MLVFDLHLAVASLDEIRDKIHRAGPIECHQRGDVLHGGELEFATQIAHTTGFQLEHANSAAFIQQVIGFLVIEWQLVHIDGFTLGILDHLATVTDDRQCFKA